MWLAIIAIVAQSADAAYTCHALKHGARELNPIIGQSCKRAIAVKSAALGAAFVVPDRERRWILIANIAAGSVGFGVSIALKD